MLSETIIDHNKDFDLWITSYIKGKHVIFTFSNVNLYDCLENLFLELGVEFNRAVYIKHIVPIAMKQNSVEINTILQIEESYRRTEISG